MSDPIMESHMENDRAPNEMEMLQMAHEKIAALEAELGNCRHSLVLRQGICDIYLSKIAALKSKNAELKKYLKHARDDKKIRLEEIGKLEDALSDTLKEFTNVVNVNTEVIKQLNAEDAEFRELLIVLLSSGDCYGEYGVEIPEELSATFDIGLDVAHRIVDILTPKETINENPQT